MEKLTSKEAIRNVIRKHFGDDERITDKLLFDGKRMTVQCFVLLSSIFGKANAYSTCLDDLGYHCYFNFTYESEEYDPYYDKEKALTDPVLKKVYERLDNMLSDDECYMVSDVINGDRDSGDRTSHRGHIYGEKKNYLYIDVWVFGQAGKVTEFVETNDSKRKLLFEID